MLDKDYLLPPTFKGLPPLVPPSYYDGRLLL